MLKLAAFLETFPEFDGKGLSNPRYEAFQKLAEIYLCHIKIEEEDALYDHLRALLVAHLLSLSFMGANPVEKAQSLESYMGFSVPDATSAFSSLSSTFYGRTVNDYVHFTYQGGLSLPFYC